MAVHPLIRAYQTVAEHLPFHLDDADHVAALVQSQRTDPTAQGREHLTMWVYAYVCRYFAGKVLLHEFSATEADRLIEKAIRRITTHFDDVREDDLFVRWVSVICKNLWLGVLRRRRRDVEMEEHHGATPASEGFTTQERVETLYAIGRGIDRLPPYLRDVARMRLVEQRSYEEISERTDVAVGTARVYYQRALKKLREDPQLQVLWS